MFAAILIIWWQVYSFINDKWYCVIFILFDSMFIILEYLWVYFGETENGKKKTTQKESEF